MEAQERRPGGTEHLGPSLPSHQPLPGWRWPAGSESHHSWSHKRRLKLSLPLLGRLDGGFGFCFLFYGLYMLTTSSVFPMQKKKSILLGPLISFPSPSKKLKKVHGVDRRLIGSLGRRMVSTPCHLDENPPREAGPGHACERVSPWAK